MTLIKSIKGTPSSLELTRQQEFHFLQDLLKDTLDLAAEAHNSRHPVQVFFKTTFTPATQDTPFYVLIIEISIDLTKYQLSRFVERTSPNDRINPQIGVYRQAFAELAGGTLILALSSLIDPVTLAGGNNTSKNEAEVINITTNGDK